MTSFDPSRPPFAPYGFTCELWTPTPMKRADRHDEIELNLLKQGSLQYLLGGRQVEIHAGELTIFWAAIPHQIIGYSDQTEYLVATIPLAWFLHCKFPAPFVDAILQGQVLVDKGRDRTRSDFEFFAQWVEDFRDPHREKRRLVLMEIEARLLRFALSVDLPKETTGRRGANHSPASIDKLKRVEEMACYIARHYARKLTTQEISRSVRLHPNYAMALFKRTFGMSMIDYATQHRVSHAQRLLATTDDKMVDIALESGFNSISRFNEAFKSVCRCSPRDYRKVHRIY